MATMGAVQESNEANDPTAVPGPQRFSGRLDVGYPPRQHSL